MNFIQTCNYYHLFMTWHEDSNNALFGCLCGLFCWWNIVWVMKVAAFESDTLAIILVYNIVFLTVVILIQIIVTATQNSFIQNRFIQSLLWTSIYAVLKTHCYEYLKSYQCKKNSTVLIVNLGRGFCTLTSWRHACHSPLWYKGKCTQFTSAFLQAMSSFIS